VSIRVSDETYVSLFIQYKPKLQELMILELARAKKRGLGWIYEGRIATWGRKEFGYRFARDSCKAATIWSQLARGRSGNRELGNLRSIEAGITAEERLKKNWSGHGRVIGSLDAAPS